MLAALALTALAACSVHPIPDDVSPVPTEGIVAMARCEMRQGLVETVRDQWFADEEPPVDPAVINPETIGEHLAQLKRAYPNVNIPDDWQQYMDIAVSYEWTFDITEINEADSTLGFKFPFLPTGTLDVGGSGKLNLQREGKRTFKNQDTFGNLLTKQWYEFCHDIGRSAIYYPNQPVPRSENIIYPITGSIGLRQAVKSFLRIAVQEGALDTFTDELTFMTTVDAKLGSTITLTPVADRLRLVSGAVNLDGNRADMHKVKISLAFPKARPAQITKPSKKMLVASVLKEMDAKTGYQLNPNWRAAYALCVVDGRSREDDLKNLRLDPPEVTCLESTDAFFPRGNGVTNALLTGSRKDLADQKRILDDQKKLIDQAKPAAQPPPASTPPANTSPSRSQ
jgi:hypothetical protein